MYAGNTNSTASMTGNVKIAAANSISDKSRYTWKLNAKWKLQNDSQLLSSDIYSLLHAVPKWQSPGVKNEANSDVLKIAVPPMAT